MWQYICIFKYTQRCIQGSEGRGLRRYIDIGGVVTGERERDRERKFNISKASVHIYMNSKITK